MPAIVNIIAGIKFYQQAKFTIICYMISFVSMLAMFTN